MDLGEKIKKLEEIIEKDETYEKSKLGPFVDQIIFARKIKKLTYKQIQKILKENANVDVSISNLCAFYKRSVKKSPAATAKQPLQEQQMHKNILVISFKGGSGKTTNASLCASYLPNATLIEIDKINQSDARIENQGYYKSMQFDFKNETTERFFQFENLLLNAGIKIIDIDIGRLEIFHNSMASAALYDLIDLLIIPAMDGREDFIIACNYLETIKGEIDPEKIIFSFNRFNDHEYDSVEDQFDNFFKNTQSIKDEYGIDLGDEQNYYVLKDSKAIKNARELGVSVRSLVERNIEEITQLQRSELDQIKRLELSKERSLVFSAQNLYNQFLVKMFNKIAKKLG